MDTDFAVEAAKQIHREIAKYGGISGEKTRVIIRSACEDLSQLLTAREWTGLRAQLKKEGLPRESIDQIINGMNRDIANAMPSAEQDAKRLDWLESMVRNEGGELNIHDDFKSRNCLGLSIQGRTLREAIDAAMRKEKP